MGDGTVKGDASARLFPPGIPKDRWASFNADGLDGPVHGVVYGGAQPAADGMPLGGIETGCIDFETNGLLGWCSIFNSFVPRRGPLNEPFLGLAVGDDSWVLSTVAPTGLGGAKDIDYWGHFPVADVEYDLDGPVQIGLRAWSPFIPGDAHASNVPAAVFEVRVRNTSSVRQVGTLAFTFPGFDRSEVSYAGIRRDRVSRAVNGIKARGGQDSYLLGVIDSAADRIGGAIGWNQDHWQRIRHTLPETPLEDDHDNSGLSVASDFSLESGEGTVRRFVLAWYFPSWRAGGTRLAGGNSFRHMYTAKFDSLEAVANTVAADHANMLRRTLAWQNVVYADKTIPGWLQDTLINSLHLIPETSLWARAEPPVGDWCNEEDGVFGMNECPRSCPQMECIPCTFYGSLPVVYLVPELALSTLRAYKAYQFENGRPAWVFGGVTAGSGPCDMASPSEGYQYVLNGSCYAETFNKLWVAKGKDRELLDEFYDSLKETTLFTMTLRPDYGDKQVISMPVGNAGQEWFESTQFFGMCSHVGGVHLAHLQMAKEWAEIVGDEDFLMQCDKWLDGGSQALEEHLWAGTHYKLYNEPETHQASDVIMAYMLDGEWISRLHGNDGVFDQDRVKGSLETISRFNANADVCPHGALVFAEADGSRVTSFNPGYWTDRGIHLPSVLMLGMTYMYAGERDFGLDLCRRAMENVICRQRAGWDWAILYDGISGGRIYGNDYYQDLVIWSLPAALANEDLSGPLEAGGLVHRMIKASA